jgi:hypothetical protein
MSPPGAIKKQLFLCTDSLEGTVSWANADSFVPFDGLLYLDFFIEYLFISEGLAVWNLIC